MTDREQIANDSASCADQGRSVRRIGLPAGRLSFSPQQGELTMRFGSAIVIAAVFGAHTPASATIITTTYTGTFAEAFDYAGVFGTPNTDLAGASYKVVHRYDDGLSATKVCNDSFCVAESFGSSAGSAVITVNGVSLKIGPSGGNFSAIYRDRSDQYEINNRLVIVSDFAERELIYELEQFIYSRENPFIEDTNYSSPFTYTAQPGDFSILQLYVQRKEKDTGQYFVDFFSTRSNPATVTVVSAIPEPATWAMMIAGFGLVGSAMRVRRKQAGWA